MGRFLLLLSFLGIAFVIVGTALWPQDLVFWFAASTPAYQYMRLGLAFVLLMQVITRPPRHMIFRVIAGALGLFTASWVLHQTFQYHMLLLDAFSLLSAALAILITALEKRVELPTHAKHFVQTSS